MIADQLELDSLFKEQMDVMVEGFKDEIPMGKSFISDTLTDKLKDFGLGEVAKLTPLIKQKLIHKVIRASAILVGIGALFGFFMGLLVWWLCAR